MQIKRPEWPGAALIGADRIDGTPATAIFLVGQKDAVFGRTVFFYAVFATNAFEVFFFDFFSRRPQEFSEKLDLWLGDPDIALFRTGTAITTAGALKVQSALIPCIISFQISVL